jgi:hypothetical protein
VAGQYLVERYSEKTFRVLNLPEDLDQLVGVYIHHCPGHAAVCLARKRWMKDAEEARTFDAEEGGVEDEIGALIEDHV